MVMGEPRRWEDESDFDYNRRVRQWERKQEREKERLEWWKNAPPTDGPFPFWKGITFHFSKQFGLPILLVWWFLCFCAWESIGEKVLYTLGFKRDASLISVIVSLPLTVIWIRLYRTSSSVRAITRTVIAVFVAYLAIGTWWVMHAQKISGAHTHPALTHR
jgi:hypothetical protein